MAAAIHPDHHLRPSSTGRLDLRLVTPAEFRDRRGSALRHELGLSTAALVATAVAFVVVVVGVLALGQGAFTSLAPEASGASAASAPAVAGSGQDTVVVQAGDTLWSIARRLQPTGDVRPLVDQLVAANGSTLVAPGDQLVIDR